MRILLPFSMLFLTSCATLYSSNSDQVSFDSDPPGADVFLKGQLICKTPCKHEVRRQSEGVPEVMLKKPGYKTARFDLNRTLTKAALFNFGFISTTFGATSWGIDFLSGRMFEYEPKSYFMELEKKVAFEEQKPSAATFVALNFKNLRNDIAQGKGDYLAAYLELSEKSSELKSLIAKVRHRAPELLAMDTPSRLQTKMQEVIGAPPFDF
jgi:hypothetical protein